MPVRFSIEKDDVRIVSEVFEIASGRDFEVASSEIWRKARQARPLSDPHPSEFLSGLDDLWGVAMVIERP